MSWTTVSDRTLLEMVAHRPRDLEDMAQIFGVGRTKLTAYGQVFVEAIVEHVAAHGPIEPPLPLPRRREPLHAQERTSLSETVRRSVDLLRQGRGRSDHAEAGISSGARGSAVAMVAKERGMAESTIWAHAVEGIAQGELRLDHVIDLPESDLAEIRAALRANPSMQLRPAYEALEGRFSYEVLRCVRAWDKRDSEVRAPSAC